MTGLNSEIPDFPKVILETRAFFDLAMSREFDVVSQGSQAQLSGAREELDLIVNTSASPEKVAEVFFQDLLHKAFTIFWYEKTVFDQSFCSIMMKGLLNDQKYLITLLVSSYNDQNKSVSVILHPEIFIFI